MSSTKLEARVIAVTQPYGAATAAKTTEDIVAYCARVSNPSNQENYDTAEKLLRYCIRNAHWSIFEMVNAVVEVQAPRDITRQLLRHSSFSFQEFSQRYSDGIEFTDREVRMQDTKNRQNSIETVDTYLQIEWNKAMEYYRTANDGNYKAMIKEGVAKECARVILPEGLTMSTLYVNGTLRSWIHYLQVREGNGTQKEHILLANKIREALTPVFPTVLGINL